MPNTDTQPIEKRSTDQIDTIIETPLQQGSYVNMGFWKEISKEVHTELMFFVECDGASAIKKQLARLKNVVFF